MDSREIEDLDLAPEDGLLDVELVAGAPTNATEGLVSELVRLRKKRKIGQEGIAKAIGVTQSRISQFENMKGNGMTLETFLLYAQTMGVKVVMVPLRKKRPGTTEGED